jgi:predicted  nucleic acid-binding Zn-ribbon protein
MPDDHIQRQMDFVVAHHAQFASDIQALKERQAESQRQIEANAASIYQLADVTMSLARHVDETDQRWKEKGQRWAARMQELTEAGAHTDRRLDALFGTVDKLVRSTGGTG